MDYKVLDSIRNQKKDALKEQFALDVLTGFSAQKKYIPSKYFYDERGSILFEKITDQVDYYPTRCEFEVFEKNKGNIAGAIGKEHFNLIELGAGDGRKTKVLIDEFMRKDMDFTYIPVDISESAVANMTTKFKEEFDGLKIKGVVGEYIDALDDIRENSAGRNVLLFLGSNIGNFNPEAAFVFLRIIWKHLNPDDYMLIGFDLKKDLKRLTQAYNDTEGVTADFNINVLRRINNELGGTFNLENFTHYGFYNPVIGAMESYLVSLKDQSVFIKEIEKTFHFKAYEPIHLEYSNKYLLEDIQSMANETGFIQVENFFDNERNFVDSLWRVKKTTVNPL